MSPVAKAFVGRERLARAVMEPPKNIPSTLVIVLHTIVPNPDAPVLDVQVERAPANALVAAPATSSSTRR